MEMDEGTTRKSFYVVDTNIFMDWQVRYYPTDIFNSLLKSLETLIAGERFVAPALVHEELDKVGTDELSKWAMEHPGIWVKNAEILGEAVAIQGRFPGLLDPKAEYEEADAYVIALAIKRNGIVVTSETPAAEKRKPKREFYIPDVCREIGVPCINLLGLMHREKWQF